MDFFSTPGADDLLAAHIDAALGLLYSKDPFQWVTNMAPLGAIEPWITGDNILKHGDYLSDEVCMYPYMMLGHSDNPVPLQELETQKKLFLGQGWAAPLNWYKVFTSGLDVEADKG